MTALDVLDAEPQHAAAMAEVIRAAFRARPRLNPESTALDESEGVVAEAIAASGGLIVLRRDQPVGALLFDETKPGLLGLRRVSVLPDAQGHGVASAMVGIAEEEAERRGRDGLWLHVREELPDTVVFWLRRQYVEFGRAGTLIELRKTLPASVVCNDRDETQAVAARLAPLLRAGDLVVLSGTLGAGKTTFTQGLGEALGVRGPVTSPTFVIARSHPSLVGGPTLLHVDAYRLDSPDEVDDLDLDASTDESVTVVEWGTDRAEQIAESRLEISVDVTDAVAEVRRITVRPVGPRWAGVALRSTLVG